MLVATGVAEACVRIFREASLEAAREAFADCFWGRMVRCDIRMEGQPWLRELPTGMRVDGGFNLARCENLVGLPMGLAVGGGILS